jgi:long-chain acyl-CoA synthetase
MGLAVQFSTVPELFERVTAEFTNEERPLLMSKKDGSYRGIRFSEIRSMVEHFALGLLSIGFRRGDMVGLIAENRPEWVVTDMGLNMIGCVNVPIYPSMTPKQIEFIFNDAGVKFAVVSNQFQLGKVLKIFDDVKTLREIVIMNRNGAHPDRPGSFL